MRRTIDTLCSVPVHPRRPRWNEHTGVGAITLAVRGLVGLIVGFADCPGDRGDHPEDVVGTRVHPTTSACCVPRSRCVRSLETPLADTGPLRARNVLQMRSVERWSTTVRVGGQEIRRVRALAALVVDGRLRTSCCPSVAHNHARAEAARPGAERHLGALRSKVLDSSRVTRRGAEPGVAGWQTWTETLRRPT